MRQERDPKTGRFIRGNQAARGNRGNTKPKWGNRNAIKHGFYSDFTCRYPLYAVLPFDGCLWLSFRGKKVSLPPEYFYMIPKEEGGGIMIREDVVQELRDRGFRFPGITC